MTSALFPTTPEGADDVASAGAELVTSDGRTLALVGARLIGEAAGGLARLVLEQTFANHYDDVLKVTYRMPLPADGAVSGYEFVIGERTVKGVVDKKHRARERFEQAIASGRTAALLEQERADIFTQQIGNIPPGERVVARITIDQRLAWLPEGEWELRFPTVIGPRYIGSADTIADAKATHVKVTDTPLGIQFQIAIAIGDQITGGAKPTSPTHALTARDGKSASPARPGEAAPPKGGAVLIELSSGTRLDRDIVVRWPVAAAAPGLALNVARRERGDAFGLVTIVPPARAAKVTPVPRDLLVLLDTSGSMAGGPLDKAKQVVALMIDSLAEGDRLELIEFSDSPRRWQEEPALATPSTKQAAIKWVRSREASGGTEMRKAVVESLATLRIGAQRQVLVVTDGYVGGEQQILEALHRKLPQSCRLHVLGVGAAVNRSLATALARAGRGAEVLVGLDEDAERGAKRLLDRTKLPMLTNVELAGSALLRHAPEKIPDVFEGAPLVAALALQPEGGELVVRGQVAGETWMQTIKVPAKQPGEGNQAIAALYGRERVADVEAHAMFSSVDGEIEELGLDFQIATRMTSWVAVDESRIVKGPARDELIPQELPYGTSAAAFGLRGGSVQTASFDVGESSFEPPAAPARAMPAPSRMVRIGYAGQFGGSAPPEGRPMPKLEAGATKTMAGMVDVDGDDELGAEFDSEEPTGEALRQGAYDAQAEVSKARARGPRPAESSPLPADALTDKASKELGRSAHAVPAHPAPTTTPPAPAAPPQSAGYPPGPQMQGPGMMMPAKPEPMMPAQPMIPPELRAKLERDRKIRLAVALALVILLAAIAGVLFWLFG